MSTMRSCVAILMKSSNIWRINGSVWPSAVIGPKRLNCTVVWETFVRLLRSFRELWRSRRTIVWINKRMLNSKATLNRV
jgi:hypothetical protein